MKSIPQIAPFGVLPSMVGGVHREGLLFSNNMRYFLYVLVHNKKAAYIGHTTNAGRRIREHRKDKVFDDHIVLNHSKSKQEILIAERSIIHFVKIFRFKFLQR